MLDERNEGEVRRQVVEATRALQGQLDALKADKVTDLKYMSERITKLEAGARHIFQVRAEREVRESVLKEEVVAMQQRSCMRVNCARGC